VEGALRYAAQRKRTGLAQKLREIADEKAAELEELEKSVEMEGNPYEPSPSKHSVVFAEKSSENSILKPKALAFGRKKNTQQATVHFVNNDTDDSEPEEVEVEEEEATSSRNRDKDNEGLRPKPVKKAAVNTSNPFKVASKNGQKAKKRTTAPDSDEEEEEEVADSDSDQENNGSDEKLGFDLYFQETREELENDFSDLVDDERRLKAEAKKAFKALDSEEKRDWMRKARKASKRKETQSRDMFSSKRIKSGRV
jgi:hypothetical protein